MTRVIEWGYTMSRVIERGYTMARAKEWDYTMTSRVIAENYKKWISKIISDSPMRAKVILNQITYFIHIVPHTNDLDQTAQE